MRCTTALLLFLCTASSLHAQTTTRLLGKVVDLAGQPVGNVRLRITGHGEPEVFNSGEFELQLSGRPAQVEVQLIDAPGLQVLYPPKGMLAVPADGAVRSAVVVGKTDRAYINDMLAARFVQLGSTLRQNGVRDAAAIDSLSDSVRRIIQLLGLREDSLRNSIELQSQQAAIKPALFKTFDTYLLEAKDLRDAFKLVTSFAARDRSAVQALQQAVEEYNAAFQALNNNRNAFQSNIRSYWRGAAAEGLTRDLADVYTEAVEEIHKGYVLPLNESLVVLQRVYGPNKPRSEVVARAVAEADRAVRQLDARFNVFEQRYARLRSSLGGT
ncbi:MAG TPA: hypothetical protein VF021_02435 [Longimicrobiales bacterium]